jgi:hypothetical protein
LHDIRKRDNLSYTLKKRPVNVKPVLNDIKNRSFSQKHDKPKNKDQPKKENKTTAREIQIFRVKQPDSDEYEGELSEINDTTIIRYHKDSKKSDKRFKIEDKTKVRRNEFK